MLRGPELSGRTIKRFAVRGALAFLVFTAGPACAKPSEGQSKSSSNTREFQTEFPFSDTAFLLGGPHSDGLSKGKRYALDWGWEIEACPGGKPLTHRWVEASASGKVTKVGNERDLKDPFHSVVELSHGNFSGKDITTGYMHLANIQVNVDQEVQVGTKLGNPSCEVSPGGSTSGVHAHTYVKVNGEPVDIDGFTISGWRINAAEGNYQGTLTKAGEQTRTADKRRCDPGKCDDIRNDITRENNLQITGPQIAAPAPTTSTQSMEITASTLVPTPGLATAASPVPAISPVAKVVESPKPVASPQVAAKVPTTPPSPTRAPALPSNAAAPLEKAQPKADDLPLSYRAAEIALQGWFESLNPKSAKPKRYSDGRTQQEVFFVAGKQEDFEQWREYLQSVLQDSRRGLSARMMVKPFTLTWSLKSSTQNGINNTTRETGIAEYNGLHLWQSVPNGLSLAEKANTGYDDRYSVIWRMVSRNKIVYERPGLQNPAQAAAFFAKPVPSSTKNFSPWKDDQFSTEVWMSRSKPPKVEFLDYGISLLRVSTYMEVVFPTKAIADGIYCGSTPPGTENCLLIDGPR